MLAEIASSPAGQTEGHGPSEAADPRPGQVELHIPVRNSQLSASGKCPPLLLAARELNHEAKPLGARWHPCHLWGLRWQPLFCP